MFDRNIMSWLRLHARFVMVALLCLVGVAVFIIYRPKSAGMPEQFKIDRIVVRKFARTLSVFRDGRELKSYRVALGAQPIGAKEQEGDMKTPEGLYTIDYRNSDSDYHLALHVSYPGPEDVRRAAARGVSAGCDIMVHGLPNGDGSRAVSFQGKDWTAGCIALTNEEIEELWRITPDGVPIEILP